ncbi:DUF1295 domain-containing protein [Shivajiella indica]|uniref:DUF1295 domain-containing protein n=1 Tax=Shivajiella indica TaxID=872115 RepID=A0ABW5BBP7_9BACT
MAWVNPYLDLACLLFIYMVCWFLIAVFKKRNDVADIAWGLGFVFLAWISFSLGNKNPRSILVNSLVTIWGLRLAWHIFNRNKGKKEDFRYLEWRKTWKYFYLRSFFQVFMLQGFFLYIIAFPVLYINISPPNSLSGWDSLAVMIWLFGFVFESLGDYQLQQFKNNPNNKGKIIQTGLWKFSRHPNYFGDAVQWWGIFILALPLAGGWITIIGPIMITYLLRYVSGVPMLERKYLGNPEFEKYKQKTSVFFPLPPKK